MLVMSMHVGVVRLDEELRLRKNLILKKLDCQEFELELQL